MNFNDHYDNGTLLKVLIRINTSRLKCETCIINLTSSFLLIIFFNFRIINLIFYSIVAFDESFLYKKLNDPQNFQIKLQGDLINLLAFIYIRY